MGLDYTDISKTYDDYRSFPDVLLERVADLGRIAAGTKVLELGCGTANAASALRRHLGANAIGMDSSQAMLKIAAAKGVPVIRADADGRGLPFQSSCFEAAIGIYVIHHISDLKGLFSECRRILHRGTLVLLTSSHSQIEDQHPAIKQFFPSFISVDIERFPDIPEVDTALRCAGFKTIDHLEVAVQQSPLDEAFLEKVKNKYISTYELIPDDEFCAGVHALEEYVKGLSEPESRRWRATLIKALKPRG